MKVLIETTGYHEVTCIVKNKQAEITPHSGGYSKVVIYDNAGSEIMRLNQTEAQELLGKLTATLDFGDNLIKHQRIF